MQQQSVSGQFISLIQKLPRKGKLRHRKWAVFGLRLRKRDGNITLERPLKIIVLFVYFFWGGEEMQDDICQLRYQMMPTIIAARLNSYMQQTKESPNLQEASFSPRKQVGPAASTYDTDTDIPLDDLQALRQYIHLNVQSQRKNILSLYSLTIHDPEEPQPKCLSSTSPLSGHRFTSRHKILDPLDRLKSHKSHFLSSPNSQEGDNMIVSNKFSQKQKVSRSPLSKLALKNNVQNRTAASSEVSSPVKDSGMRQTALKVKAPLPQIRFKAPALKVKRPQPLCSQLNPWQYLVIPDQPQPYQQ